MFTDGERTREPHPVTELPCGRCGHPQHAYVVCGAACDCEPAWVLDATRTRGLLLV